MAEKRRRRMSTREGWYFCGWMVIAFIVFSIFAYFVSLEKKDNNVVIQDNNVVIQDIQRKVQLLKGASPEIQNEYVSIEECIQKMKKGEANKKDLQNMFNVLSNQIAPHFASKATIIGTYGDENSVYHGMVIDMMIELSAEIQEFEK